MILLCLYFEISFLETGRGRLMWSLSQIRERCPRHSKKWQTPKPPEPSIKLLKSKSFMNLKLDTFFLSVQIKETPNPIYMCWPLGLGSVREHVLKIKLTTLAVKLGKGKSHKMKKGFFQISQSTLPETTLF